MKEIIKVLLEEGIDEQIVHRVLDLIEEEYEVISEVTITKWRDTARKVLPDRVIKRDELERESDRTEKLGRAAAYDSKNMDNDGTLNLEKYHKDPRYIKHHQDLQNTIKANNRISHAASVANLPQSNHSAQKLRRAADNSFDKRENKWSEIESSGSSGEEWTKKVTRAGDRMEKAGDLSRRDTIVHGPGQNGERY